LFIPNYNVLVAEIIIPAADICQQISSSGFEASGTSNMKFQLNCSISLGSLDGANVEIKHIVGVENFYRIGSSASKISEHTIKFLFGLFLCIMKIFDFVIELNFTAFNTMYDPVINELFYSLATFLSIQLNDKFFIVNDFDYYIKYSIEVDKSYLDTCRWSRKTIIQITESIKFASDRTINEYADKIWGVQVYYFFLSLI